MPKAVFYFANGIGNFVMMMPAIQALRDMTGEPVDMFISPEWVDGRKLVVELICDNWDVVGKKVIEVNDYDYWFYSPHSSDSNVVLMFKHKLGGRPSPVPAWKRARVHERDHYMEIVRGLGYVGSTPIVKFPMADRPVLSKDRMCIGLCNGAFGTEYWRKKQWPHFDVLVKDLKGYFNAEIVGVGGPEELSGVSLDQDFTGKLNILESAKVISQLDLLITTDTGCMHIADMLGIPIVALFGPTLVSKNGPLNGNSVIVRKNLDCAPCQYTDAFRSCGDHVCMSRITIADVMIAARKVVRDLRREHAA